MLGCDEHDCCLGDNCAQTCWTLHNARLKLIERAIQFCDRNPEILLHADSAELKTAIAELKQLEA